jgi:hypothetical protein
VLSQWKRKLQQIRFGKIWWYNFEFDLLNNLTKSLQAEFLAAIEHQLEASAAETSPVEVLISVLESNEAFSLQGRQVCAQDPLSCVITAHAFAHWLIDRDKVGLGASEVLEQKIWDMFERGVLDPELYYKGQLSSKRNFFWATLTKSLNDALSIAESSFRSEDEEEQITMRATEIRNLLGLSYMEAGIGLYRVDLPQNLPDDAVIRVPTTLDSSPTCVFLPVEKESAFGKTFHLMKQDTGAEEVIISPVEFSHNYTVSQIGFVSAPLPDDNSVWSALETRVLNRRVDLKPKPKRKPH